MILKWLDHASFLLKVGGRNFYIDPYAGEYVEKADAILVSHCHIDHCDRSKVAAIYRPETLIVTSAECAKELAGDPTIQALHIPPTNILTLAPDQKRELYGATIEAVEAYNDHRFRSAGVPYHPKGTGIGFIISAEGKRIYHAGDTDFIPSMMNLRDIDIALLPIMGRATMDVDEAVEAAIAIHPKAVLAMHRREANAEEFRLKLEARAQIQVLGISPGEEITV